MILPNAIRPFGRIILHFFKELTGRSCHRRWLIRRKNPLTTPSVSRRIHHIRQAFGLPPSPQGEGIFRWKTYASTRHNRIATANGMAYRKATSGGALKPLCSIPQTISRYTHATTAHMACDSASATAMHRFRSRFILTAPSQISIIHADTDIRPFHPHGWNRRSGRRAAK